MEVDGELVSAELSPEQAVAWDAELARHERTVKAISNRVFDPETIAKSLKGEGFRHAAAKRAISGLRTAKEAKAFEANKQKLVPNRVVEVQLPEGPLQATILARPVYGKVKVEFGDGSTLKVDTKQVRVIQPGEITTPPPEAPVTPPPVAPPTPVAPVAPSTAPDIAPQTSEAPPLTEASAKALEKLDEVVSGLAPKAQETIAKAKALVGEDVWRRRVAEAVVNVKREKPVRTVIVGVAEGIVNELAPTPPVDMESMMLAELARRNPEQVSRFVERAKTLGITPEQLLDRLAGQTVGSIPQAQEAPPTPPAPETTPRATEPTPLTTPESPPTGAPLAPELGTTPPTTPTPPATPPNPVDAVIQELNRLQDLDQISDADYLEKMMEVVKVIQETGVNPTPSIKLPSSIGRPLKDYTFDRLRLARKSIASLMRMPEIAGSPMEQVFQAELDRIGRWEEALERQRLSNPEGGFFNWGKKRKRPPAPTPSQNYFRDVMPLDPVLVRPRSWIDVESIGRHLGSIAYIGVARPAHAAFKAVARGKQGRTSPIPSEHHPGKLVDILDGSITQAHEMLVGDGPFFPTADYQRYEPSGAMSLLEIVTNPDLGAGDVELVGHLAGAYAALETAALHEKAEGNLNNYHGPDPFHAFQVLHEMPPNIHAAVRALREYKKGVGMYMATQSRMLPYGEAANFAEAFGAGPFQLIYGNRGLVDQLSHFMAATHDVPTRLFSSLPIDYLPKTQTFKHPIESMIDMTYRLTRFAKLNEIGNTLIDLAEENPTAFRGVIDELSFRDIGALRRARAHTTAAVRSLYHNEGIRLPNPYAEMIAATLDDNALGMKGGIMQVVRNGKTEWRLVDSEIALMLKSASPMQLGWMMKFLVGAAAAPTRLARFGIISDPVFQTQMKVIDQFQGWANTKYGWKPGVDEVRGFLAAMERSPEYKQLVMAGGVVPSRYLGPRVTTKTLTHESLAREARKFLEPIFEAGRVGEGLLALKNGESAVGAVWASRELLGNYSNEGAFTTVRIMNQLALFARPAIAVTDKLIRTVKEQPGRWAIIGGVAAGIAAAVWALNKDDEEIRNLRNNPGGFRWLYFRLGDGTIGKWRKPFVEGAIWMTTMEHALDALSGEDPEAARRIAEAIIGEFAIYTIPVVPATAIELWANKRIGQGYSSPIISNQQRLRDPAYQFGSYSGPAEKIIGRYTSHVGLSPAEIHFLAGKFGGLMGESAFRALNMVIEWRRHADLPPAEEWPLMQRLLAVSPSFNDRTLRDFYRISEKIEIASNSINVASDDLPDDLDAMMDKYGDEALLMTTFAKTRRLLSDQRKLITAAENNPEVTRKEVADTRKTAIQNMILDADLAVRMAKDLGIKP